MKDGHVPVLAEEVVTMLAPAPGSLQIDATVGGGGHTERILEATDPDGRLLGLDADGAAIARVRARLGTQFGDRLRLFAALASGGFLGALLPRLEPVFPGLEPLLLLTLGLARAAFLSLPQILFLITGGALLGALGGLLARGRLAA